MFVHFHVTDEVRQGGILSSILFNLYMNDLSRKLRESETANVVGNITINHLIYANYLLVLLSLNLL